jgi:ankyrin repeat protein
MEGARELIDAIRAGDAERVRALLASDPSVAAARDEDGISAVLSAQYRFRGDLVDLLLAAEPELDVFEAAALGRAERVAELLDSGPSLVGGWSADGYTALHLAAFFGHRETAALLIRRGAEIDVPATNAMRVTPLHSAAAGRRFDVAKLLVETGADVDARQAGGWTPLHSAAQNGDSEFVRLLLDHGADPLVENDEGRSPLDLAKSAEVIALLEDRAIPEP